MSFTVKLQTNNSDENVLSKNVTDIMELTGVLKRNTSIINPVIEFSGSIPTNCNYMTIETFGRSYFVTDIISTGANRFEISAHVDVLSTYAGQIRNCTGIIARQRNNWNLYIDDGSFKVYQNPIIDVKQFPNGFTTSEFVLAIAGS